MFARNMRAPIDVRPQYAGVYLALFATMSRPDKIPPLSCVPLDLEVHFNLRILRARSKKQSNIERIEKDMGEHK
ncbi:MAG: hypothetical protein Ta2B_25410 [Termitinemataceae bacterium]|nr:MAG: hypothetical protein Ta2B_25410 [Termitinemataceae bacterium]